MISPIINTDGSIIKYIMNQKDITIQKEQEEKFRQAQKMEAIGKLASGIAHDFNNVLTAISLSIEVMGTSLSKDNPLMDLVDDTMKSIDHASSIIDRLLMFSKKQDTIFMKFNPKDSIKNLTSWIYRLIGARIQIDIDIIAEGLLIHADRTMLDQVIVNLIINAKDAMPNGGKLHLELSSVTVDKNVITCTSNFDNPQPIMNLADSNSGTKSIFCLIRIEDNGIGMDDSTKEMLFEPFFTTKEEGKGTGLGLSTSSDIIRDFGGFIDYESILNKGTIFYILIPAEYVYYEG
jgi:hypothetical protein